MKYCFVAEYIPFTNLLINPICIEYLLCVKYLAGHGFTKINDEESLLITQ